MLLESKIPCTKDLEGKISDAEKRRQKVIRESVKQLELDFFPEVTRVPIHDMNIIHPLNRGFLSI